MEDAKEVPVRTIKSDQEKQPVKDEVKLQPKVKSEAPKANTPANKVAEKEKVKILEEPIKIEAKEIPIPKDISKDEIEEPDVMRNLYSMLYWIKRYEEIEPIYSKETKEGKVASKKIFEMYYLFDGQKAKIQDAIESEAVTFEQYKGYLEKSLTHDKVLLKYYEDYTKANSTANKCLKYADQIRRVKLRIEWIMKELTSEPPEEE